MLNLNWCIKVQPDSSCCQVLRATGASSEAARSQQEPLRSLISLVSLRKYTAAPGSVSLLVGRLMPDHSTMLIPSVKRSFDATALKGGDIS
jgi:hypothetical protein